MKKNSPNIKKAPEENAGVKRRRDICMLNNFTFILKQLLTENCVDIQTTCTDDKISLKEAKDIYIGFLDKVAVRIAIQALETLEFVDAVLKLARIQRIIVVFNIIQGMELSEVAELLSIKVDSVYTQKSTALKRLRSALEDAA